MTTASTDPGPTLLDRAPYTTPPNFAGVELLKIVLYSIDYGETVVRTLPYVRYLSERSLYHLSDLRRLDTRIVLITPADLDPYILDYHFRELYQLDEGQVREALGGLVVITPAPKAGRSLGERVLMDPKTLERLGEERKKISAVELINYAPALASEALAVQLGVEPEEGPYDLSLRWGSKSGSKEIFRIAGVPTPAGSSKVFRSGEDVENMVMQMAKSTPASRRLVIKLDDPSWGNAIGNAVINCDNLLQYNDMSRAIETIAQPWEHFIQEIPRCGAIVEHYLAGSVCSPSVCRYV